MEKHLEQEFAYHIEFAHCYADDTFSQEHSHAVTELKKYLANRVGDSSCITSVLIDEFNPEHATLDIPAFISMLQKSDAPVDFVAYESKFQDIADQLIAEIPRTELRFEHFHGRAVMMFDGKRKTIGLKEFSTTRQKHTCAILSAAWTLCRLGAYDFPAGSITDHTTKKPRAKKIVTILPETYRATEEKMKQIISSTRFAPLLERVEHVYF